MTTPKMGHYGVSVRRCWTISAKLWVTVVGLHNNASVKRCRTFKSDTISSKLWVTVVDLRNKSGARTEGGGATLAQLILTGMDGRLCLYQINKQNLLRQILTFSCSCCVLYIWCITMFRNTL